MADTKNKILVDDIEGQGSGVEASDASAHSGQRSDLLADNDPESPDNQATTRSGEDARHRGWFWHWNNIVTQYAPLIGLKGIGLLNSYTTWTDRREHSPYHGFAFPSQKSEASFYGEDRAELITINKILVALDLIEIRKEMIPRTDDQGRRWKVPHNFYRVKDRTDGKDLTYEDVARVIELAAQDKTVFRYLRRLFSNKFKPIDSGNPWHKILGGLESNPTWQELRLQIASKEAKASARARAGHKSRAKKTEDEIEPSPEMDNAVPIMTNGHSGKYVFPDTEHIGVVSGSSTTSVEGGNTGSDLVVERINTALPSTDEQSNSGFDGNEVTFAEEANTGSDSVVEQSNTMYYQEITTTTTTDSELSEMDSASVPVIADTASEHDREDFDDDAISSFTTRDSDRHYPSIAPRSSVEESQWDLPDTNNRQTLDDQGTLVVSLFESANDRAATGLERILLSELERDADPAARAAGSTGSDWVAAALREAVASGSSFVAPKRIREIVSRWASEGVSPVLPGRINPSASGKHLDSETDDVSRTAVPFGSGSEYLDRVWEKTLTKIRRSMDNKTYDRLFSGSSICTLHGNRVHVRVASQAASEKLSREYFSLIARCLGIYLRRDVEVTFEVAEPEVAKQEVENDCHPEYSITIEEERDGRQLWNAVLALLGPSIPARDLSHLQGIVPLGQNTEGSLILGLPGKHAERLYSTRYGGSIEDAVGELLGAGSMIIVCGPEEWTVCKD